MYTYIFSDTALRTNDERYIQRCFDLARQGAGNVSPNPMVGAVLVYNHRIIGEGFHQKFGGPHAEVNALASVQEADRPLIPKSTLYVSLEPCCVFGKTPPCTNLILDQHIPEVVISCLDKSPKINGHGVEILRSAGVRVRTGILEEQGSFLVRPSNVFQQQKRPYLILKWAQTANGIFAPANRSRHWISHPLTRRLTHQWRMESDAILVGATTALQDNPSLDNRFFYGKSPRPIILDRFHQLPDELALFHQTQKAIRVCQPGYAQADNPVCDYIELDSTLPDFLTALMHHLHTLQIGILLIEGGAYTLQTFIDQGLWDEIRILQSDRSDIPDGIPAPRLPSIPTHTMQLGTDQVLYLFK